MRYELVFHFERDAFGGDHDVSKLEDTLRSLFRDSANLQTQDLGPRGVNFLIQTRDPAESFARCKYVLNVSGHLEALTAAFRPLDGKSYSVIWPEGSQQQFIVD